MKKAAILLAEGFEEVEAMTPVDLLRRAGIEVKLVSIDNAKTVKGAHNIEIMVDEQIKNIKAEELDLIILPGGMPGTKYLDASREVAAIVESVNKNNKFDYFLSQEIYNSLFKTSYTYNLYKLQNENFLKLKNNSHYRWF